MNAEPRWVMHIPVISTKHMPKPSSLVLFEGPVATYPEGGFAYLPDDPMIEAWTIPILAWLRDFVDEEANWVRFDCDADVIDGLPTYDWGEFR